MTAKPAALPVQFDKIPQDLRANDQWLCWRYIPKRKPDGSIRWAKVPFQPDGRPAKSNDPSTWCSYDDAADALILGDIPFDGIGFVFAGDDGLFGIDLDDCRDPVTGKLTELAQQVLQGVDGYAEVSPSGTGIKVFTRGQLDRARADKDKGIELYPAGRYFTVTGHRINGHDSLPAMDQDIGWFVAEHFGDTVRPANLPGGAPGSDDIGAALELYKPPLPDWDLERVQEELLPYLDPDVGYAEWVTIGMALHHQGGGDPEWFDAWDQWSAQSSKYVEGECEEKWRSFSTQRYTGTGAVTIASLLARTKTQRQATIATQKPGRYHVLSADELARQQPLTWAIKGVLPATGLAVLYGQSGAGKSFLAIDLATTVAAGDPYWFGFRVHTRPVTIVALEGQAGLSKRVSAWAQHHDREVPHGLRFVVQPFDLREASAVEALADAICATGGAGGMVVIDTMARAAPGMDENGSQDMGAVIEAASRLQDLIGGLVILVAHAGKDSNKGPRGHSSLFAAADAVLEVRRDAESRSWRVEKSKDDADGESFAFKLAMVKLGTDEDLEDITSCVVVPSPDSPRRRQKLSPSQQLGLTTLQKAIADNPRTSPEGMPAAHLDDWRPIYYQQSIADNTEAKRRAFNRARSDLVGAGLLRAVDDVYSFIEPVVEDFLR